MLLGLAIGDALGITSEGKLPAHRHEMYGEIRDYLPNKYNGQQLGYPSDDSQLAFWTLERMLLDGGFVPDRVAHHLVNRGKIFGIGSTVKGFIKNYKKQEKRWYLSGPKSAGNGALMRIAPLLLPQLHQPSPALWADTALAAMLTHNDSGSTSACLSFINILWQVLAMSEPPSPNWWLDTYVETARHLEKAELYQPRGGLFADEYTGPLWQFVSEKVGDAYRQGLTVLDACEQWQSGAFLLETMPCVIYILMRHGDDPEEAIVRAVNDTKDNDSVAAIVGTAVGALHGKKVLPARWRDNLVGRTTDSDDGHLFELIEQVRQQWCPHCG
ncbi:MAG: ADP-ribosylglycohydrolase family protein [Anaerolineae bacterium]